MASDKDRIGIVSYDVDTKWDACLDLTVRRFVYSSVAGCLAGLLLFRSPVSRKAAIAFGAGIGIGSAYTECSHKFNGFPLKFAPPAHKEGQE